MIENQVGIGIQTFWNLSVWSRRESLLGGLEALGYRRFVPEVRTPLASLKDALGECHKGRDFRVENLKNRDGYEVVKIERGNVANGYDPRFSVTIDANCVMRFNPYPPPNVGAIVESFNEHRGLVRTNDVAGCLVEILRAMGGTSLPGGKGNYFVPPAWLETWKAVAGVVEAAGCRRSAVYVTQTLMDAEAIRAVRDGVMEEVLSEVSTIEKEIDKDDLGVRALEARGRQADQLQKKIALYEGLLGVGLESLRAAVEDAKIAAGRAYLLASAAVVSEVA